MPYEFLALAVGLATCVWVWIDADRLDATKGALGGGLLDMGTIGWFAACLLVWIIAFPCYLLNRPRLVRAKARRAGQWQSSFGQAYPQPYVAPNVQPYTQAYAQAYGLPYTEPSAPFVPDPDVAPMPIKVRSSLGVQLAGLAAIAAVVGLIAAAGPEAFPDNTPNAAPAATPVAAASTPLPTTAQQTALDATLTQIALGPADLQNGFRMQLEPAGDQVSGQATLDNCGYRFTTETDRVARRETALLNATGQHTGIGNEVVAYRTGAQSRAAVRQWYFAAAHCPRTAVSVAAAGGRLMTEHVSRNSRDLASLPNRTNALTIETATTNYAPTVHEISILQVHGRFLDAVFAVQTTTVTDDDVRIMKQFAVLTGRRLAEH